MVDTHQNSNIHVTWPRPLQEWFAIAASTYYDQPTYQIWSLSPPTTKIC